MTPLELLYEALHSDHGVRVETNIVYKLINELKAARKNSLNADLDSLTIYPSPENPFGEVWIVKEKEVSNEPSRKS